MLLLVSVSWAAVATAISRSLIVVMVIMYLRWSSQSDAVRERTTSSRLRCLLLLLVIDRLVMLCGVVPRHHSKHNT